MEFEIIGAISGVETIAVGRGIRELTRLIRLDSGEVYRAEIHWYEAHGIGRKEHKIMRRVG